MYQRLNGHPSNYWINKHKKLKMCLNGYYNIYSKNNSELTQNLLGSSYSNADEENKRRNSNNNEKKYLYLFNNLNIQSKQSLIESGSFNQENIWATSPYTKDLLRKIPVDVTPYDRLSIWRKYIRIFTPFEIMFRSIWVNDWFVYPQFLLTWILIWFFSMIYFSYFVLESLLSTLQLLNDSFDQVYENSFNFIRNGVERYFDLFKYEPTSSDLDIYFSKLTLSSNNYDQLLFAMKIGAFVGLTLAVVIVFINIIIILYDYKQWVLDARKGIFRFNKENISIKYHSTLSGAIISNNIFMFFIIIITMTIIFIFIAWPLFWRVLWFIKWKLILLCAIGLGVYILKHLIKAFLFGHDYIKNRTLLSFADIILLQLSIISGLFSSILRFIKLICISFVSIMKINVNSMPYWLSESMHIDSFNNAYYASIMVQHTHNNPVVITFHNILYMTSKPVNSDKELSENQRVELNR